MKKVKQGQTWYALVSQDDAYLLIKVFLKKIVPSEHRHQVFEAQGMVADGEVARVSREFVSTYMFSSKKRAVRATSLGHTNETCRRVL